MNKLLAFTVYDSKAEAFLRPYFAETKGLAMRAFRDAVNDPSHEMHKHAEDYTLFHIGFFNQQDGSLENGVCDSMATAITLREASK